MNALPSQKRPRPRPVVSCLRCRDKKLKCDRATPCQNCIKAACTADCTYNQNPAPNPTTSSVRAPRSKRIHLSISEESDQRAQPESPRRLGIIEDLQQRVVHLEELVAARPSPTNLGPLSDVTIQNSFPQDETSLPTAPFQGTLVVKGSRSRYHGQNNRITLLNQFPDAKAFINRCGTDSGLVGLAKEVQFLQSKTQTANASPESIPDLDSFPELQFLLDSLPPKALCDHLIDVYTKNFEKALRIIHVPSFLSHYSNIWQDAPESSPVAKDFVPLLTAVLTVAAAVLVTPPSDEHSSSWSYLKENALDCVQAWMNKLPRKQRTRFATLQVGTLLLLSRQLSLVETEELWKASGDLVRSAMVMGLHINTKTSIHLTPYQQECRKRLWITIAEMDLQLSISSGMPVMVPELDFQPLTPSNLNDSEFDEATISLPRGKDLSEDTDALYQICLAASLPQRIKTINLAQHTNQRDSLEMRWRQLKILKGSFEKTPLSLEYHNELGEVDLSGRALNRVILDVFLHRPLLTLLQPLITTDIHHENPCFPEIQKDFLEYSISLLSYQDSFDPNLKISGSDFPNSTDTSWEIFQAFFHQDIISAALGVCEYMRNIHQMPPHKGSVDNQSTSITLPGQLASRVSLIRLVENTLDTLTRRISERGTNVKDVLLLAVVFQSTRSRGSAAQQDRLMSQGAQKALSACKQHLLGKQLEESFLISNLSEMPAGFTHAPTRESGDEQPTIHSTTNLTDLFEPSSVLAAEFENFESDLFTFDDGSFLWNL